jgi:hypothetical protein
LGTAAIAGLFIVTYVWRAAGRADRLDEGVLVSLLFFAGAAVLSQFPRQSFDALLGALALTAILFFARRELAREGPRIAFIRALMGLSAVLTFATASRWLSEAVEWWSLAGRTVIPPLEMNFSAVPWGHRHDLTLLLVMLFPSWWIGQPSPLRRAAGTVVAVLTALIVIVDGSRMLWLALAVSTAVLLIPHLFRRLRSRGVSRLPLLFGTLVALGVLVAGGFGIGVIDRLLNLQSLGWRYAMWAALADAWLAHPLAGLGPGSFPWVLQMTDYFQTNSWAPRHPDSVLFQLVAEAGILGIAAVVTLAATLAVPVLRGRSTAAAWALATFVVAGVGSNPTDFAFLCVLAVGWVAYAVPRHDTRDANDRPPSPPIRIASLAGLLIIAAAYSSTIAATFFYEGARQAVARGDIEEARTGLNAAIALDPGIALYLRQRGTLSYLEGDASAAVRDLQAAARLNPGDDLAWRTLALASAAAGDTEAANSALNEALATQRSDPTNLLLRAYWQRLDGQDIQALATLGEVVRAWPATIGAAGWDDVVPDSVATSEVVDEAVRRWLEGSPSPESFSGQGVWLAVLADRPDLFGVAADELGVSEGLAEATIAVLRCDSQGGNLLDGVAAGDRRTQLYWHLRVRTSARWASYDEDAIRIIAIMSGAAPINRTAAAQTLNPLRENGWMDLSADIWGYRRLPIKWPAYEIQLPSPEAGAIRWLLDPVGALMASGLEERLPACV